VDNGAGIIEMAGMSRRPKNWISSTRWEHDESPHEGYASGSRPSRRSFCFNAFLSEAQVKAVDLAHPETFVGRSWAALVFLFTALHSGGRAAQLVNHKMCAIRFARIGDHAAL